MSKNVKHWLIIIFTTALVLRLLTFGFLLSHGGEDALLLGDSHRYLSLAQNLVSGNSYSYEGFTESYRAPGYPAYLVPFVFFHLPLWVASLIQIIFASLIPIAVFYLGRFLLPLRPNVAIIAALIAAVEPVQVFYSVVLMPDVFTAVFFLASIIFLILWFEFKDWYSIIAAGISLGLLNYLRPVGLYFSIFVVLGLISYLYFKKQLFRESLLQLLLFGIISYAILLPWCVRNEQRFGKFSFVSSSAYTLYLYGAAASLAVDSGKDYNSVKAELFRKLKTEGPGGEDVNSFANQNYLISHSLEIINGHKLSYLKTYLLGLNTFLFSGNYHYLLAQYGIINPPAQGLSFSLLLVSKGIGAVLNEIGNRISNPYFLFSLGGKFLWLILTVGAIIGGFYFRKTSLGFLFLLSILYFSITILSVTIGVEARHRYLLNPLIFLFFVAVVNYLYDRYFRSHPAL